MTQITRLPVDSRLLGTGRLPETRLGVQFTRYPGHESRPLVESVQAAVDDGFTLVVLNSIAAEHSGESLAQPDKPGELDEVAEEARHSGVEIQLGLGCAGPFGDPATVRAGMGRALSRGVDLGITEFFVHTRSERQGAVEQGRFLDHPAQLRLIRANLEALAPAARDARVRINLKTHEDLASPEVLALVQALDPAVFGIGFDVANLVVRAEDPIEAARSLGPYIRMTHLEDAVLFPLPHGYRRRLRAIGEGVFDWEAILGHLLSAGVSDFTLEQHRGKFDSPVFDRSWFTHEPHLDAAGLGQLARLGVATHDGVAHGRIPALADWDDEPGPAERRRQLLHSAATLRGLLTSIGAVVKEPATILSGEEGLS
ncbi:sugar phosphate isomerase/epimerase [Arthrobacter sp. AZCC_0090]|uniref:sugar phosphate isomerase/epimerase family protein n=1 Tax=Arthrobacter sp. AZCC_0090 TaxID=2735881 RepID=UPI00160B70BA|nr:TIM barrel protein [Arthrobacter sp. AZCC_0090]MBB6405834.1 sugar phosphate isomerase/epimerase [Arthrobacter sp. AZCC_0090]